MPQDGLDQPQRFWAVLAVALGLVMAVLDGAIANVALPTIAADVHVSPHDSVSIINAYQIAVLVLLLPFASLGEILGYKRIFLYGVVLFTCASFGCAMSSTLDQLTIARIFQGCGAACQMSVSGALIRFAYPRAKLGQGLSINALTVAASTAAAPSIASAILAVAHWEWLFAINVPIGFVCFAVAYWALPLSQRSTMRYDLTSAALCVLSFGIGMFGIMGLSHGRSWLQGAAEVIIGILAGVFLVRRQLTRAEPLLPIDLLRIPLFRLSIMTSIFSFCAQLLAFIAIPFYVQDVLGRSEVMTGLLMTPWPVVLMVVAPIAGRLSDRMPAGLLGGIGLGLYALGLGLTALLPAHPENWDICWRLGICGAGFGLFQSPNNRAILGSAPRHRSGGANGMLGMARLTGQTLGATLCAVVFKLFPHHGQMQIAMSLACALAVIGMGLSFLRLRLPGGVPNAAKG
ncbi:MFS transporter [Acidisoma cellulosilytica]|uniref:MFS transporter n=1 Tax=Acidisoma cellulosilyticum TaxID=2802395 RepID=A0A963Z2Z6_9PROT|nr:MFS transporter [Acidisoma cellulosilyticum]